MGADTASAGGGLITTLTGSVVRLFPDASQRRPSRAAIALSAVAVGAGTLISLARTTGAGPLQSIWEEDARNLLSDALMEPGAFNLLRPFVGYFQLVPRLMGEIAAFFPISWAAAALSVQAAVVTALLALAVYVASGSHLAHPLARLLVAAPMLFAPTAENVGSQVLTGSEIYNRPATLQFFVAYAMLWLLLWTPATRLGRIGLAVTIGLTAISTFLVVIFVPLALLRLYAKRDRLSVALAGFLVAGGVIQFLGLATGITDRAFATPRYEPLWALSSYVLWATPHSILGWRFARDVTDQARAETAALVVLAWLIIAVIAFLAVRRITRPLWALAIVAFAHSVGLACMTIMANGEVTQRYLLPVEMLLFTALVALLNPAGSRPPKWALAPLAGFAAFVLVIGALNYRWTDTHRARSPLWTQQVKAGYLSCQSPERREVQIRSGPEPYYSLVIVPCHVFRQPRWCQPPYCAEIDAEHRSRFYDVR